MYFVRLVRSQRPYQEPPIGRFFLKAFLLPFNNLSGPHVIN